MKNYFKKFSIVFLLLLTIIGAGSIQCGIIANAATIGKSLRQAEAGWKRFDDKDINIEYSNLFTTTSNDYYGGTRHEVVPKTDQYIKFAFYGSKLRLIDYVYTNRTKNSKISFDGGKTFEICSAYGNNSSIQTLYYEKTGLDKKIHNVIISIPTETSKYFCLDALDIDSEGYLQPYSEQIQSILLDKSSIDLTVNESKQLTATTTPAGADVVWSSSNASIATVDENGNVKGIAVGTVTITAQIKGSEIKATCTVNASTGGTTDPTNPTGDANLFIELVDGNIKQYSVSSDEIDNFIKWFKARDNDDNESPVYKFTKGSYKDYVVHDKIDWFEVR